MVDSTVGHEMFSLMDGFLGYNQIKITSKDQHKITFTTPLATFFYKVMLFGLENARPIYQRVMTYIFHKYIHDIMEDYVDDLLSNSKSQEIHLKMHIKIFDRLLEHNI